MLQEHIHRFCLSDPLRVTYTNEEGAGKLASRENFFVAGDILFGF